jgi:hypothetical protein
MWSMPLSSTMRVNHAAWQVGAVELAAAELEQRSVPRRVKCITASTLREPLLAG